MAEASASRVPHYDRSYVESRRAFLRSYKLRLEEPSMADHVREVVQRLGRAVLLSPLSMAKQAHSRARSRMRRAASGSFPPPKCRRLLRWLSKRKASAVAAATCGGRGSSWFAECC